MLFQGLNPFRRDYSPGARPTDFVTTCPITTDLVTPTAALGTTVEPQQIKDKPADQPPTLRPVAIIDELTQRVQLLEKQITSLRAERDSLEAEVKQLRLLISPNTTSRAADAGVMSLETDLRVTGSPKDVEQERATNTKPLTLKTPPSKTPPSKTPPTNTPPAKTPFTGSLKTTAPANNGASNSASPTLQASSTPTQVKSPPKVHIPLRIKSPPKISLAAKGVGPPKMIGKVTVTPKDSEDEVPATTKPSSAILTPKPPNEALGGKKWPTKAPTLQTLSKATEDHSAATGGVTPPVTPPVTTDSAPVQPKTPASPASPAILKPKQPPVRPPPHKASPLPPSPAPKATLPKVPCAPNAPGGAPSTLDDAKAAPADLPVLEKPGTLPSPSVKSPSKPSVPSTPSPQKLPSTPKPPPKVPMKPKPAPKTDVSGGEHKPPEAEEAVDLTPSLVGATTVGKKPPMPKKMPIKALNAASPTTHAVGPSALEVKGETATQSDEERAPPEKKGAVAGGPDDDDGGPIIVKESEEPSVSPTKTLVKVKTAVAKKIIGAAPSQGTAHFGRSPDSSQEDLTLAKKMIPAKPLKKTPIGVFPKKILDGSSSLNGSSHSTSMAPAKIMVTGAQTATPRDSSSLSSTPTSGSGSRSAPPVEAQKSLTLSGAGMSSVQPSSLALSSRSGSNLSATAGRAGIRSPLRQRSSGPSLVQDVIRSRAMGERSPTLLASGSNFVVGEPPEVARKQSSFTVAPRAVRSSSQTPAPS